MARKPRPWYRADRDQWCVVVSGKRISLGVSGPENLDAAVEAYRLFLQSQPGVPAVVPPPPQASPTVGDACRRFLDRRGHLKPGTLSQYRWACGHLVGRFGTESVTDLDPALVLSWVMSRDWSSSSQHDCLSVIAAVLKEAGNPVEFRKPPKESRGSSAVIPPEIAERVIALAHGEFGPFLRFLWLTGCRPGEAANLTADAVDLAHATARIRDHKTRGKTGKDRLIFLTDAAVVLLREQVRRYPRGPLFPGPTGKVMSPPRIVRRMRWLSKKVGHPVVAYAFRHDFATRALVAGVPDTHVAAMLGHSDTSMVSRHYSHVSQFSNVLREAADKANGKKPAA